MTESIRVIFLDMDGVLNNRKSMQRASRSFPPGNQSWQTVDVDCVRALAAVVHDVVNCKIVVSSTWRRSGVESVQRALAWATGGKWNPPIIGATPYSGEYNGRGAEIDAWLNTRAKDAGDVVNYAIVDDDVSDMLPHQEPHVVRTVTEHGLTLEDAFRLRAILERR